MFRSDLAVSERKIIDIYNSKGFIYLSLFVLSTSEFISLFPILNDAVNFMRTILCIILLYNQIVSRRNDAFLGLTVCFQLILTISSIYNGFFSISNLFYIINALSTLLLSFHCINQNPGLFLHCGKRLYFVLLFINIMQYLFNLGIASESGIVYLLGIRIEFTLYCFTALAFLFTEKYFNKRTFQTIDYVYIIVVCLNLIIPNVVTGILGLLCILISFLFIKNKNGRKSTIVLFSVSTFLFFYIVIYQMKIGGMIENLFVRFGKDITFSGRTFIWKVAIEYIKNKPLIGYGNQSFYVPAFGGINHPAHNNFLEILYQGGFISLIPFVLLFIFAIKNNTYKLQINKIYISILFALTIMMITEIFYTRTGMYFILSICYFFGSKFRQEVNNDKKNID